MNTFETSETTAKLDAALAEAQGHIEVALKEKENKAFKDRDTNKVSKYADLKAIWDAARPALAAAKISTTQWPVHSDDGRLHMVTRLAHEGEWMRAHFSIPVTNQTAHGYGGAITYVRRFCFAAALGVVTDEDDDGNSATQGAGNGFPPGNKDVKYTKTTGTTPGAVKAQDNNAFYKKLQAEIDEFRTKNDGREWRKFRELDIAERVSPEAMIHLSERYEDKMATLP